jgi:hypothetical protein
MSAEDPFDSAEEAAPTKRIDWMQVALLPLWRARLWIVVGAGLSAGLGGVQALMKPNEFSSVGKLLVRTGSRESKTAEGRVIGDSSGAQASLREAIQNQIHLITTPEVYRRLVANLGPSTILEPYDPTAQDNENTALHTRWIHKFQGLWFSRADACRADPSRPIDNCPRCVDLAEEVVSKGLIVFPELGSSILSVAYTAQSPEVASKVVDGFLGAARAHHREVFDVDPALQFLDQKVKDAKVTWDIAEAALTEYRNSCSLRDYEEQSQAHLKRIDELEAELNENEARLADLKRQIKYYREALDAEPATLVTTAGQPPKDNPEYEVLVRMRQSMQIELAAPDPIQYPTREKLEARQQQLRTQIADIDARLATTPAQLRADAPEAARGRVRARGPDRRPGHPPQHHRGAAEPAEGVRGVPSGAGREGARRGRGPGQLRQLRPQPQRSVADEPARRHAADEPDRGAARDVPAQQVGARAQQGGHPRGRARRRGQRRAGAAPQPAEAAQGPGSVGPGSRPGARGRPFRGPRRSRPAELSRAARGAPQRRARGRDGADPTSAERA